MKNLLFFLALAIVVAACNNPVTENKSTGGDSSIVGTWQLVSGATIEKNDTVVTDYTKARSFIKVINTSHFSFMGHDLTKGKDAVPFYSSGGGTYTLQDSNYTEHLQYCSDRAWEGNDFHFTIRFQHDTLVQQGLEKIDSIGVNRINIEKYIKVLP